MSCEQEIADTFPFALPPPLCNDVTFLCASGFPVWQIAYHVAFRLVAQSGRDFSIDERRRRLAKQIERPATPAPDSAPPVDFKERLLQWKNVRVANSRGWMAYLSRLAELGETDPALVAWAFLAYEDGSLTSFQQLDALIKEFRKGPGPKA